MKKCLIVSILITSTLLIGCAKSINNHEGPVWISTEKNGVATANQDIKVITFDNHELVGYDIVENEDGSITVTLEIDDPLKDLK